MSTERPWQEADRLRDLYVEQRYTMKEVSEELGCSRKTVENWINTFDLKTGAKPWRNKDRLRHLREQNLSESDIADKLGCSQSTVHNWLEKFGIDTDRIKSTHPWHDESTLRKLYREREMTMEEVAEELNCSREAVEEWIHQHNIETRSWNPELPNELEDENELRRRYVREEQSTYEISEDLECAPSTVHDWLTHHGIETRSVGSQPGELHHRWKGGRDPYYGENWRTQRRKAIERDGRKCVLCGVAESEHQSKYGSSLDVHHQEPLRTFDDPAKANEVENLMTLCRGCHNRIEPPKSPTNE